MGQLMDLLNGQPATENITENNYTSKNSNVPDKTKVTELDIKTAMRK
jgi:hypothetical protein